MGQHEKTAERKGAVRLAGAGIGHGQRHGEAARSAAGRRPGFFLWLVCLTCLLAGGNARHALADSWHYRVFVQGVSGVKAVAAGGGHTVALKNDGTVVAWGLNDSRQTSLPYRWNEVVAIAAGQSHTVLLQNDGTVSVWGDKWWWDRDVPAGLNGVVDVAAGAGHTVALKSDGTVVGWGRQMIVPAGLCGVVAVAAGYGHVVALKSDGTVAAWGENSFGQTDVPPGLGGVVAVAAGNSHTVALKNDGTVVVWGRWSGVPAGLNDIIAVSAGGDATVALRKDGTVVSWGYNYTSPRVPAGLSGVVAVSMGQFHTVALKSDGTIVSWGWNYYGQTYVPAGGLYGLSALAAGGYHTVALKNDGTVAAWGINTSGETNVPSGLSDVIAIAAGSRHTMALRKEGSVVAWGEDFLGRTNVPEGLTGVIAIAAGGEHSVALRNDNSVVAWGSNSSGQTSVPEGLSDVVAVAAGGYHTMALKNDGTVTAWGENGRGQTSVPAGLGGVIAIAAGNEHSVALRNDGSVVAWGSNFIGETSVPEGLSDVVAVAAGGYHTVALKKDGAIIAWGDNSSGPNVPWWLNNGFVAIAAGGTHTVALKKDGALFSWGNNDYGQGGIVTDNFSAPHGSITCDTYSVLDGGSALCTITPEPGYLPAVFTVNGVDHLADITGNQYTITDIQADQFIVGAFAKEVKYFRDADGDGYGDPSVTVLGLPGSPPAGYVADNTDCNDDNATTHPGAPEVCGDGVDNDCNLFVDDGPGAGCTPLCSYCHGNPPKPSEFPSQTGSQTAGAHGFHTDPAGYNLSCAACHGKAAPQPESNDFSHGAGKIEIGLTGAKPIYHGQTSVDPAKTGFDYQGVDGTTVVKDDKLTCQNTYCHSQGKTPTLGYEPPSTSPRWDATWATADPQGDGNTCNNCHAFPPAFDSHALHASRGIGCQHCHASVVDKDAGSGRMVITDKTRHVNGAYDVDGGGVFVLQSYPPKPIPVSFDYTFAPGGGTCTNNNCHLQIGFDKMPCLDCPPVGRKWRSFTPVLPATIAVSQPPACPKNAAAATVNATITTNCKECSAPYTYEVNWGDGSAPETVTTTATTWTFTHTYWDKVPPMYETDPAKGVLGTWNATWTVRDFYGNTLDTPDRTGVKPVLIDVCPVPNFPPVVNYTIENTSYAGAPPYEVEIRDLSYDPDYNRNQHYDPTGVRPGSIKIEWGGFAPGGTAKAVTTEEIPLSDTPSGRLYRFRYSRSGYVLIKHCIKDNDAAANFICSPTRTFYVTR